MSGDALHIIKKIINEYSSFHYPAKLDQEVLDWLGGDRHVKEKEIAIRELFDQIVVESGSLNGIAPVPLDDLWNKDFKP